MPRGRSMLVEDGLDNETNRLARGEDVFVDPEDAVAPVLVAPLFKPGTASMRVRPQYRIRLVDEARVRFSVADVGMPDVGKTTSI